ncbi:MAG: hypothetical protein IT162_12075 [Bryobacterales bacterium]|nr:hypothetical protein [Bryobacterales bacterium]
MATRKQGSAPRNSFRPVRNELVDEVYRQREAHSAQFGHDLGLIFADLKEFEKKIPALLKPYSRRRRAA